MTQLKIKQKKLIIFINRKKKIQKGDLMKNAQD